MFKFVGGFTIVIRQSTIGNSTIVIRQSPIMAFNRQSPIDSFSVLRIVFDLVVSSSSI